MMPSPLSQLLEVALGTQGCVNFNSLRTLLVAIVRQLEEGSQSQLDRHRTSVSAPCIPASSSAAGLRQHRRSGPQRGDRVSPQSASGKYEPDVHFTDDWTSNFTLPPY